jgi:single-stranded-DNA-specific exonuclease
MAEILLRRGHVTVADTLRFLEPKLAHLTSPESMVDRAALGARLARGIEQKERIVAFGDYDCDGITATAILSSVIEALGGIVAVELASRFDGGYGLSGPALERVLAHEPGLVVTCDCGSADHESIRKLRQRGIDCLVIDHHLVPEEPLPALAFLNPHRPECSFPYKGMASCGLVLSVAGELRRLLKSKLDIRQYLDLVAIGTIADVAPLDGDNRALVRTGLEIIGQGRRPGLRALMRRARLDLDAKLTAQDVAFRIAPRLNAPGRMGDARPALQLLVERNEVAAEALADQVESLQIARRAAQDSIVAQAEEDIVRAGWQDAPAIVVGRSEWNIGIVGIVAGKLVERYQRPIAVYGAEGSTGRGSVRGPAGASLYELLVASAPYLTRFGGHHAAAGFELELERVSQFREAFVSAAALQSCGESETKPNQGLDEVMLLADGDNPLAVARELHLLEPCGSGNPPPTLGIVGQLALAKELRGGHLRVEVALPTGERVSGFAPGFAGVPGTLGQPLLLVGSLRISSYTGRERAEVLVSSIVPWDSDHGTGAKVASSDKLGEA